MPAAPRAVTGNIATLTGEAREGIAITFTRTGAGDVFGQYGDVVVNEPVRATSGEDGAFTVTLYPGIYAVRAAGSNGPKTATMTLNEDGSADFAALIGQASGPITNAVQLAAEAARDKAEEWAENPEDDPVETGQFSALHHAIKAADSAAAAHDDAAATAADRAAVEPLAAQVALDAVATEADRIQTGLDRIATDQDRTQTGLDRIATGDDRVQTGLDAAAAEADRVAAAGHEAAAEVAASLAQTAALSMIGPEALFPVDDFPIPDGWWDTNVRYGVTGAYDERAVISNWHPALVADGRDLFWFSALEADADGGLRDGTNGGRVQAAVGIAVGTVFPTYPEMDLGTELSPDASFSSAVGWTIGTGWAITSGQAVASGASGFQGISRTVPAITTAKFYLIEIDVATFTSGSLDVFVGTNGSSSNINNAISQAGIYQLVGYLPPGQQSSIGLRAGPAFTGAVNSFSVREIMNGIDFAHLTQVNGTLRFLLGRQPVSGVRNLLTNSDLAGVVAGTPGTPPTGWSQYIATGAAAIATVAADAILGGNSIRITSAGDRLAYQATAVSVLPNSEYRFTETVEVIGGTPTLAQTMSWVSNPAGAGVSYLLNGVPAPGGNAIPVGTHQVTAVLTTAATGGTSRPVFGVGIFVGQTADIRFSNPRVTLAADAALPYQRTGIQGSLDVTEEGVRSIPVLRGDLNDDRMGLVLPSKNLLTFPEDFTQSSAWAPDRMAVTATGLPDPLGRSRGARITCTANGGSGFRRSNMNGLAAGEVAPWSFYAKHESWRWWEVTTVRSAVATRSWVDLQNRVAGASVNHDTFLVEQLDDAWVRITAAEGTNGYDEIYFTPRDGNGNAADATTNNGATAQIAAFQIKRGLEDNDFEGDVVGTGIIAGRAGIWAETVRNPRLITREVQTALTTGKLLPGSDVLGLPAIVHGPSTDPSRGLVDLLLYDRVLSEAEIKKVVRRLRGAGAKGRWTLGPELVTNGTFDSGITGWVEGFSAGQSTFVSSGGKGVMTVTAAGPSSARWVTTLSGLTIGRPLILRCGEFTGSGGSGDRYIGITNQANGTGVSGGGFDTLSLHTQPRIVVPTVSTMYLWVGFNGAVATAAITVDNISVRALIQE